MFHYNHSYHSFVQALQFFEILVSWTGNIVALLEVFLRSVLCLLCCRVRLFIDVLWSSAGKGLTSLPSFVMSNCEFLTFPLVSWVRCGT